jgi:hypothetical protein
LFGQGQVPSLVALAAVAWAAGVVAAVLMVAVAPVV